MRERDLFTDQASTATGDDARSPAVSLPPASSAEFKNPLAAALVDRCEKCSCAEHVDVRLTHAPHNGRSVRRDCARCGWTLGFPVWYGEESEAAE